MGRGSNWCEVNRMRVSKLIRRDRMAAAGLVKVDEAMRNGKWEGPSWR